MGSVKLAFKSVANKVSFSRFAGLDRMNASKSTGLEKKGAARQPFPFFLAILENQLMLHASGNFLSPWGNGKRFYPMPDKHKFTVHENCLK